ncbi:unnamed protein product [Pleuronectes platessa]|uniref:Uncharacterized protein n=1 Tax=Pleuronectes platessa TaxID=8262 RepID=A0A9N7VK48_PLEPL|nr:unnamed protein product [Pleuronectes platessa]
MTGSEHRTVCLALLDRQRDQMVGSRGSFKSRPGNRERTWDVMFVEVRQKMGTMETPSFETNLLDGREKSCAAASDTLAGLRWLQEENLDATARRFPAPLE